MDWPGGMAKRWTIDFDAGLGDQFIIEFRHLDLAKLPWFMMHDAAPDAAT